MTNAITEAVQQFFADHKNITVGEMNELLIEIIGASAKSYCEKRLGTGATREQINAELPRYLDAWSEWQGNTLEQFRQFVREVNDDQAARQTTTLH